MKIMITSGYNYKKTSLDFLRIFTSVFLYFSPEYSTYTQSLDYDLFDILEREIVKYQKHGKILIGGDFNARVGTENDFISQDSDNHLPLFDSYIIDSIPLQRRSYDHVLNTRGKQLLNLCVQCGLRFLNGRMLGDSLGQYTSHQPSGSNVIDYFIASESILSIIPCFRIFKLIYQTIVKFHCKSKQILVQILLKKILILYLTNIYGQKTLIFCFNKP